MNRAGSELGDAVAKAAFMAWTRDNNPPGDASGELAGLMAEHVSDRRDRQRVANRFASVAEIVSGQISATVHAEFRYLDDSERDAALLAVARTLSPASLARIGTPRWILLTTGADVLERSLRQGDRTATRDLSEGGVALYDAVLSQCCRAIVDVAGELPRFQSDAFATLLSNDRIILERIGEVLSRLPAALPQASPSTSTGGSTVLAAARRIAGIRDSLGEGALRLAYHAALPVVVDAELLNLLRVNFFLDPPYALPYEIEAELLLSPLFREVGQDLFEIEPGLRNILLLGLRELYKERHVHRVAELLGLYTDTAHGWQELERAQRLTVMSFLDPAAAERYLDANEAGPPTVSGGTGLPPREWYVAMRRRISEHSATADHDEEFATAWSAFRGAATVRQRLEAIETLRLLARLSRAQVSSLVNNLCALVMAQAGSTRPPRRTGADVQAALTVIGSLPHDGFRLENVVLSGVNLAGLNFARSNFGRVTLVNVDGTGLDLSQCALHDCAIVDTALDRAVLDKASVSLTELTRGSYHRLSLRDASISIETMRDVDLSRADLNGAVFQCESVINVKFPATESPRAAAEPNPDPALSEQAGDAESVGPVQRRARDLETQGQWEEARALYRDIVSRTAGTEPVPLVDLARASTRLGAWDEAVASYEAALNLYQHSPAGRERAQAEASVLMSLGDLSVSRSRTSEAIERFERAQSILKSYGNMTGAGRAGAGMARAYAKGGMLDAAERHLRAALGYLRQGGARRDEAGVLANLADTQVGLGRLAEAISSAESATRIFRELDDPTEAVSIARRTAEVMAAAGLPVPAASLYRQAVDASAEAAGPGAPETADLRSALTRVLLAQAGQLSEEGHLGDALDSYREALSHDPGLAEAHTGSGDILMRLQRPEEAARSFVSALDIDPADRVAQAGLRAATEAAAERTRPGAARLLEHTDDAAAALLSRSTPAEARELLTGAARTDPVRTGLILGRLPVRQAGQFLDTMSRDAAAAVVEALEPAGAARVLGHTSLRTAADILADMGGDPVVAILAAMSVDTAVQLLRLLPAGRSERLIKFMLTDGGTRPSSSVLQLADVLAALGRTEEAIAFLEARAAGDPSAILRLAEWLRRRP